MPSRDLPIISLFTGAMGLDLGLEQAGCRVRVAVECNRFAAETIRQNRPDVVLFEKKLEDVSTKELLKAAGLRRGEPFVVTGGPSCQAFSTAGQRGSMGDPRGEMFREFLRVVREAQPRFFVMENVRGVLSAAVRHRPLKQRGPGYPALEPDEELGSALMLILRELSATKYHTVFDLVNAADYGVPQARERVLFIGSRDGKPVRMPVRTHAKEPTEGLSPWVALRDAIGDLDIAEASYHPLCQSKLRYMELVPEGGNWRDLPKRLQAKALGAAYVSWGGRSGFFRRLAWDRPAPSMTTRPDSKATMLCHPSETRPLSVQEYARVQQFPDDWTFDGGTPQQYLQIGNAVPVGLGRAVGQALLRAVHGRSQPKRRGTVRCANPDLIERISRRPRTVLNPPRMRKFKQTKSLVAWLDKHERSRLRSEIRDLVQADG